MGRALPFFTKIRVMNKMGEPHGKSPRKIHLKTSGCQMNAAKMTNIGFVPNLMVQVVENIPI